MTPEKSIEERPEPQNHTNPKTKPEDRRIYRREDGYDTQTPLYSDWASI